MKSYHSSADALSKARFSTWLMVCLLILAVSSCATLSPNFESPNIQVLSIKRMPSQGMDQQLVVELNVQNPNSMNLPLTGVAYALLIEGNEVASGVTADVSTIPAYGEAQLSLPVTTNLMGMVRLVTGLMMKGQENISYELVAKLDVGIPLIPKLSVSESGEIPLSSLR
ncbi:MAG: LEA type 2 family protein [Cellvibrionaceae bacterium]